MKNFLKKTGVVLTLMLAMIVMACASELDEINEKIASGEASKTAAHTMAEQARFLGEPEDGVIVQKAKQHWQEANQMVVDLSARKDELEQEAAKKEAWYKDILTPKARSINGYNVDLIADDYIKQNSKALGNYRLSFYCPCAKCNGVAGANTASGTVPEEGRTIAVDSSIIPLGSRVYIDGYGVFTAEDTGGAIKNSRIDVHVKSHSRAYELGIKYANVYLLY